MRIVVGRSQICKLKVLGTKKITERVPVTFEEREREVDITAWDCEPLLTEV